MTSRDNTLNVLQKNEEKEKRFFMAWKRGVELMGKDLFGPRTPVTAKRKEDLTPHLARIKERFPHLSGGEEQFISAMVSFYSPDLGEQLVRRIDCEKSLCGLTYNLDHAQVTILCELLANYPGWPEGKDSDPMSLYSAY